MDLLTKLDLLDELNSIRKEVKSGTLSPMDRLDKLDRKLEIYSLLKANVKGDNSLIKRFLAGGFNDLDSEGFIGIMRDVHSEGLELEQVKNGAFSWLETNGIAA